MAWTKNGTPLTLSSTADDIDITDLTAKKFNMFMIHLLPSGNKDAHVTYNNNGNSVYAHRKSFNGGTDSTNVSDTKWDINLAHTQSEFRIVYLCSISGEEKLGISFGLDTAASGAGTTPTRDEFVTKFVPSPDADVTRIDLTNTETGDFAANSNVSALGTD